MLSLIIPIYNVENYIFECLQSIEKSILKADSILEVEVICVNDGSTDNSLNIVNNFLSNTKCNFQCFSKVNGGLSDARNYGIKKATKKYISFIDSDDFVSENYISSIFSHLHSEYDLIFFDFINYFGESKMDLFSAIDDKKYLWTVGPSAWNKVWKRELFSECMFPIGKVYEDIGTTYKLLVHVKKWKYIEEGLYYYRKNRVGSILTSGFSANNDDIYEVLSEVGDYIEEMGDLKKNREGLEYQYIKLLLWSNLYRQMKIYKLNLFHLYSSIQNSCMFIEKRFPNWKSNNILNDNSFYFTKRMGKQYMKKLDMLGNGFFKTMYLLVILVAINYRRR